MAIDVDTVATDQDIVDKVGLETLETLIPKSWEGSAQPARQEALDRILDILKSKNPPVHAADLSDPSELRRAVVLGALAELHGHAMIADGDAHHMQWKRYDRQFRDTVGGLSLTLQGQLRGPGLISIPIERR